MTLSTLPSGLSAQIAKKDAKSLKRQNPTFTHMQALDLVCERNGYKDGWSKFMAEKPSLPPYSGSNDPYRNLLVRGVNHLVEAGLISLEMPPSNTEAYDGALTAEKDKGHVFTQIDGKQTVIMWSDVGHGELRVSVWWDYDHSLHPQANLSGSSREGFNCSQPLARRSKFKDFVGVTCSCWVERKTGKHLQGRGRENIFDMYTRKSNLVTLKAMKMSSTLGYKAEGKFFM